MAIRENRTQTIAVADKRFSMVGCHRRACKTATMRSIAPSYSGDNFSTVKLVTGKEEKEERKGKVLDSGLGESQEREKVLLS